MAPVLDHPSVPLWARTPTEQPVDPAAASCSILTFGEISLGAGWSRDLTELGLEHHIVQLRPGDGAELQRILTALVRRAVVGWRLMLAGPLADVLHARSLALTAGLLDAEILVSTTEVDRIPVSCAHCARTTLVTALTTGRAARLLTCGGCGENLVIHEHLSPLRAGFLGVKHDAPAWPEAAGTQS